MQRAYDQMVHDVALQKLNVVFCLDRAGIVGDDGATHHGVFDIAFMRSVPNMIVAAPMDEIELRNILYTSQLKKHGPFSIRYPRGRGNHVEWKQAFKEIGIGKARIMRDGDDIAILSLGSAGNVVTEALPMLGHLGIDAAHYDMRFAKPLDEKLLHSIFTKYNAIITIEDGVIQGGFGSAVLEFMADNDYNAKVKRMGVPDTFIEQGTQQDLFKECGIDSDSLVREVKKLVSKKILLTSRT